MIPLKRNTKALSNTEFDLLIIGGGIFGVCAAWDAALRGLSVAIIEKNDFAHATSSNHFKMVHGGIRYIQHADVKRIRESSRERSALLRIAPHLVRPLPIVIPTYGYGMKGKPFLGCGIFLYDFLTMDRNRGLQKCREIPRGSFLSREEILSIFPGLSKKGLTGGALIYDGQMYNPPRLAISFLRAAVNEGAVAANYLEAENFIIHKNCVSGIKARDTLSGNIFEIRAKWVLNTTGPWAHRLLESKLGIELSPKPTFSRDLAFVVKKKNDHGYALAFSTKAKDADSIVDIGGRRLFSVPWRNYTLIGVWHRVFDESPDQITVTKSEMDEIIHEVNEAYPRLEISPDDITMINMGLTLFGEKDDQDSGKMSFGKRSRLIDHFKEHALKGITTLIGVRATTARGMAEKAVGHVMNRLGRKEVPSRTAHHPIYGGDFENFETLLEDANQKYSTEINSEVVYSLVSNYGSKISDIANYFIDNPDFKRPLGKSLTIEAEVIHAVRNEMAQKLGDVVFRRTDLSSGSYYDSESLKKSAELVARELGWDTKRIDEEMKEVIESYPKMI